MVKSSLSLPESTSTTMPSVAVLPLLFTVDEEAGGCSTSKLLGRDAAATTAAAAPGPLAVSGTPPFVPPTPSPTLPLLMAALEPDASNPICPRTA